MISNMVVADAVVHPYDLAPPNQNPAAQEQLEPVYAKECGLAPLTETDILGLNRLRMHGLEAAEVLLRTADNELARARAHGIPQPWSALRAAAA